MELVSLSWRVASVDTHFLKTFYLCGIPTPELNRGPITEFVNKMTAHSSFAKRQLPQNRVSTTTEHKSPANWWVGAQGTGGYVTVEVLTPVGTLFTQPSH